MRINHITSTSLMILLLLQATTYSSAQPKSPLLSEPGTAVAKGPKSTLPAECSIKENQISFNAESYKSCLDLSGYIFANLYFGRQLGTPSLALPQSLEQRGFQGSGRAEFQLSSHTLTDLGVLHGNFILRANWYGGDSPNELLVRTGSIGIGDIKNHGTVTLGYMPSYFYSWIPYGSLFNSNPTYGFLQITSAAQYRKTTSTGLDIGVAVEQKNNSIVKTQPKNADQYAIFGFNDNGPKTNIDMYDTISSPYILAAASKKFSKVQIATVNSFNFNDKSFATRDKIDVFITPKLAIWAQAGFKNFSDAYAFVNEDGHYIDKPTTKGTAKNPILIQRLKYSAYGDWGGSYYFSLGSSYQMTDKLQIAIQAGLDAVNTFNVAAGIYYQLGPNIMFLAELDYVSWNDPTTADVNKFGVTQTYGKGSQAPGFLVQVKMLF